MMASEKANELGRRETGLPEHRAARAGRKLSIHRHDDRPAVASELHMATALAHLHETGLGESSDDLGTADDRQPQAHAESSTVAMIGGSMASGRVWSSKYSSSASRRLARASSAVRP